MKRFLLNKQKRLSERDLAEVLRIFHQGGVIVFPTDTSYGLAARIDKIKALKDVFALKGRVGQKTVSMAVRSRRQAEVYGRLNKKTVQLWRAFMPGPLTLVVPSKKKHLPFVRRDDGTVAIRLLPTALSRQLLRQMPVPVTITSANKSGKEDIYSYKQFLGQYRRGKLPAAFIDAGKLAHQKPSTVISITDKVEVLRKGPISLSALNNVLKK